MDEKRNNGQKELFSDGIERKPGKRAKEIPPELQNFSREKALELMRKQKKLEEREKKTLPLRLGEERIREWEEMFKKGDRDNRKTRFEEERQKNAVIDSVQDAETKKDEMERNLAKALAVIPRDRKMQLTKMYIDKKLTAEHFKNIAQKITKENAVEIWDALRKPDMEQEHGRKTFQGLIKSLARKKPEGAKEEQLPLFGKK